MIAAITTRIRTYAGTRAAFTLRLGTLVTHRMPTCTDFLNPSRYGIAYISIPLTVDEGRGFPAWIQRSPRLSAHRHRSTKELDTR